MSNRARDFPHATYYKIMSAYEANSGEFFLFPSRDADLSSAVVVLSASVFSLALLSSSSSSSYYQFFSRSVQHRFFARVFLSTALLTVNEIVDANYIASKKQNTKLLPTTAPNINRFSFFH